MPTDEYIVDLHLHSKYSRATSKYLDLAALYLGAKLKGIDVLGTSDFTHPIWFSQLQHNLVKTDNDLYQLAPELRKQIDKHIPDKCRQRPVFFVPTVEVSCIYHRHGRLRKLHHLIVMPDMESAGRLNRALATQAKLAADGRPTLTLDSVEVLKLCLDISTQSLFIPAHIWTPWFGLFGSKSGFDSLEEAFGDWRSQIHAVETGLSSDPPMNWRVADLDQVTLISNSDAHSAAKLGREATVLKGTISYQSILSAIKTADDRLVGTIEFFPEEGKYHVDGHRSCGVSLTPQETKQYQGLCPVCDKPLTVGVLHRVDDLAVRTTANKSARHRTYESILPLSELIAHTKGIKSSTAKTVRHTYHRVLSDLGSELAVLRHIPVEVIDQAGYPQLSRAILKMRQSHITIKPGYDGVYGTVNVGRVE